MSEDTKNPLENVYFYGIKSKQVKAKHGVMINIEQHNRRVTRVERSDREGMAQAMAIREEVFIRGQGVDPMLERDQFDLISHHYLALVDGNPVGTARWRETTEGIKLERFAVLAAFRNQKIGEALLLLVLEEVIPLKKPIYLNAQMRAIPFYERHGFITTGDPFLEAGIRHVKMIYTSVNGSSNLFPSTRG